MISFFHDMHTDIFYNICGTYRRLERNVFLFFSLIPCYDLMDYGYIKNSYRKGMI